MSAKSIRRKNCLLKKSYFLTISRLWVKWFLLFGQTNAVGLSKLQSTCPKEPNREFFSKKFWDNLSIIAAKLDKNFSVCLSKLQSKCPVDQFDKKKSVMDHLLIFGEQKLTYCQNYFDSDVKTAIYRYREPNMVFCWKFSWNSSKNFFNFCRKDFPRFVRTAFYVTSESIWWKTVS